jgi:hypothetical protein
MQRLIADADLRGRLGVAARARAAQFSPDSIVPQFERAYEAAVARRRPEN